MVHLTIDDFLLVLVDSSSSSTTTATITMPNNNGPSDDGVGADDRDARQQQEQRKMQFSVPDYTSPPTQYALENTPVDYRGDDIIDEIRQADELGECQISSTISSDDEDDGPSRSKCHIPFSPDEDLYERPSKIGVIIYVGGLVDPRSYSPIAHTLQQRYGVPSVIPIFASDIALPFSAATTTGVCYSGRIELAKAQFPKVEKWVLVGHSLGGLAAMGDLWTTYSNNSTNNVDNASTTKATIDDVAGLVMLAADINQQVGCGDVDFSATTIPMAALTATEDLVLNKTRYDENKRFFPQQSTFFMDIVGGNHAQFGSYDNTERYEVLNQIDGNATIPEIVQLELTVGAIMHVASRSGLPLPTKKNKMITSPNGSEGNDSSTTTTETSHAHATFSQRHNHQHFNSMVMLFFLYGWLWKKWF